MNKNDKELLEKIWNKVQYLNHCSTELTTDMKWVKKMIWVIIGALFAGFVKILFDGYL